MRIGIDVMGGDNAPKAPISAAIKYALENKEDSLILYGNKESFDEYDELPNNIEVVYTTEVISTHDEPAMSIRSKKDSSLVRLAQDCKSGEVDSMLSAGSTGAIVASGVLIVRRIKGIQRPCLPGAFPTKINGKRVLIVDLGANTEPSSSVMHEHALLANTYAKSVLKVENPNIKLLNIGEEDSKGTDIYKEAYKLLKEDSNLNFTGNLEARYIFDGEADIIVCDGFVGNMTLKSIEGTVGMFSHSMKEIFNSNIITKLSGLMVYSKLKQFKKQLDYKEIGGTPIFGIDKLMIKAHGSSNELAFYNAIKQSKNMYEIDYINRIKKELKDD